MEYTVRPSSNPPSLEAAWEDAAWREAETLEVRHFRPEGSEHRPHTSARLLYDATGIHGLFRVADQHVRCVHTNYNGAVWRDSCVEFFAQPKEGSGYFNFEFNCGGAFLCSHITDHERVGDGFKAWMKLPPEVGRTIRVRASLPDRVEPEIADPVVWTLRFAIPFALFERYVGPLGRITGQTWRGNFYKCADQSSHPHWASWAPVDELNFHLPSCFGVLRFG